MVDIPGIYDASKNPTELASNAIKTLGWEPSIAQISADLLAAGQEFDQSCKLVQQEASSSGGGCKPKTALAAINAGISLGNMAKIQSAWIVLFIKALHNELPTTEQKEESVG